MKFTFYKSTVLPIALAGLLLASGCKKNDQQANNPAATPAPPADQSATQPAPAAAPATQLLQPGCKPAGTGSCASQAESSSPRGSGSPPEPKILVIPAGTSFV